MTTLCDIAYGWLTPECKFLQADYQGHYRTIRDNTNFHGYTDAMENGYIHLTYYGNTLIVHNSIVQPTPRQFRYIRKEIMPFFKDVDWNIPDDTLVPKL